MTTILFFIAIPFLIILFFISIYNKLIKKKNLMQEGWSGIDVFLKKRHDLIPNLVETVKGYATHEKGVFEAVTLARSKAMAAGNMDEKQAAEASLGKALVNMMAVAEQYPDLKANVNFQNLQEQLSNLEGDIEKARRYYNGTARDYNISVESFPGNVVAGFFKFNTVTYYEVENEAERETPQVKF
ncbi:MAG: LemA family protein [Saprospiraceae bacterium]|jgi:LemA protein|nr:LemA family protein [Saprospiraceae bacterium]MCA0332333.1 LemA family protein [Bacteroidota bacterium]MCB0604915.1 LemA family protein [Saprospiraceae bacterium]MCO5279215.1 LemA family protein [Saprospiraceae bacterium]